MNTLTLELVAFLGCFCDLFIDSQSGRGVEELASECRIQPRISQVVPSIESPNSIFAHDILKCCAKCCSFSLFGSELNDDLDHIDGLNDAGGHHAGETTDPERLYSVEEFCLAALLSGL